MENVSCLVFEPDVSGHRLQHVRHLTEALLDIGCEVAVALQSDARNREEYRVHVQPLVSSIKLLTQLNPRQANDYATAALRVDELLGTIEVSKPDWVYVPYADRITQAAAVRGLSRGYASLSATPIEGQVMRGRYAYPKTTLREHLGGFASRWLMQRSPWRVTHLLDTLVYENLRNSSRFTEFRLIPEPVEPLPQVDRTEARRVLGIPTNGRYVATAGGMDPRKGIDLLLAAFAQAKLNTDDRLLLVGKMSQPVRDLIARDYSALVDAGRVLTVDRYVSDRELGCGFVAGDVLVTPHPRHVGSSGTLVRAVAANRPIIAADFGWVGWATREFGLGTVVDVADTSAFAAAIETELSNPNDVRVSDKSARFRQYHTVTNQKAHWVASLGEELGVPLKGLATRLDWTRVVSPPEWHDGNRDNRRIRC